MGWNLSIRTFKISLGDSSVQSSSRAPAFIVGMCIEKLLHSWVTEASEDVTGISVKQPFPAGERGSIRKGQNLPVLKDLLCVRCGAEPPAFISFHPYCNTKRLGIVTPFYRYGNGGSS